MKITALLIVIALVQASAKSFSQQITLHENNAPLTKVIKAIQQQSGYQFLYTDNNLKNEKLTIQVDKATIEETLKACFDNTPIDYKIVGKSILLKKADKIEANPTKGIVIRNAHGRVLDETGAPLIGVTVKIKDSQTATSTDANGYFNITIEDTKTILQFSFVGYQTLDYVVSENTSNIAIFLKIISTNLNEVLVNKGYYSVKQELNTGSVVGVKASDIEKTAVNNPLIALAGRVSGVTVTQTSGNIGAGVNIQIRGLNSISQGSSPLYIIDGVPFLNNYIGPLGNVFLGANSSGGGQTPFSTINPSDIESIEILKDADATAIYGSRGANGVVLVTTKKAKQGSTSVEANVAAGVGSVSRTIQLMNTSEYLSMRKEAFANDGRTPTNLNAPDVLLWNNDRYTDWQKEFIGGTAKYYNANIALSGGNSQTRFRAAVNYNKETTVYPGDFSGKRGGYSLNVSHTSKNKKFQVDFLSNYSNDNNSLPTFDFTRQIALAPNAPPLFNANGGLNWQENGGSFVNPYSNILNKGKTSTENFSGSTKIKYVVYKDLEFLVSGGINNIDLRQDVISLKAAQNPLNNPVASASRSNTSSQSWIIEPQLKFNKSIGIGHLEVLMGNTLQKRYTKQSVINASGFPNDELIFASAFATTVTAATSDVDYRYAAYFGRINYNVNDTYIINATARRDGSSRFGPGKQWGNFGAIGAAWIFSNENFMKKLTPIVSFGKVRGSIGITGNDQIGDYQFYDNYSNAYYTYQSQVGYTPSRIFNPDYAWERNKKIEGALELGFIDNKILLNINYYNNTVGNQLINYTLPSQTGFSSLLKNFEAVVQNSGWEFELQTRKTFANKLTWATSFNISFNSNKLKYFPDLEKSSYANSLVVGQPVNIIKTFDYKGVDPTTGIHSFSGTTYPTDLTSLSNINPKFFGGINNQFTYKNFDISFLFQFVKTDGYNYDASVNSAPGSSSVNLPKYYLNRWTHTGQNTDIQKFATTGAAYFAYQNYRFYSNGIISDASFIRLKNISLGYSLKWGNLGNVKIFVQGQNLITLTNYKGLDPETAYVQGLTLPTLKVFNLGARLTF